MDRGEEGRPGGQQGSRNTERTAAIQVRQGEHGQGSRKRAGPACAESCCQRESPGWRATVDSPPAMGSQAWQTG